MADSGSLSEVQFQCHKCEVVLGVPSGVGGFKCPSCGQAYASKQRVRSRRPTEPNYRAPDGAYHRSSASTTHQDPFYSESSSTHKRPSARDRRRYRTRHRRAFPRSAFHRSRNILPHSPPAVTRAVDSESGVAPAVTSESIAAQATTGENTAAEQSVSASGEPLVDPQTASEGSSSHPPSAHAPPPSHAPPPQQPEPVPQEGEQPHEQSHEQPHEQSHEQPHEQSHEQPLEPPHEQPLEQRVETHVQPHLQPNLQQRPPPTHRPYPEPPQTEYVSMQQPPPQPQQPLPPHQPPAGSPPYTRFYAQMQPAMSAPSPQMRPRTAPGGGWPGGNPGQVPYGNQQYGAQNPLVNGRYFGLGMGIPTPAPPPTNLAPNSQLNPSLGGHPHSQAGAQEQRGMYNRSGSGNNPSMTNTNESARSLDNNQHNYRNSAPTQRGQSNAFSQSTASLLHLHQQVGVGGGDKIVLPAGMSDPSISLRLAELDQRLRQLKAVDKKDQHNKDMAEGDPDTAANASGSADVAPLNETLQATRNHNDLQTLGGLESMLKSGTPLEKLSTPSEPPSASAPSHSSDNVEQAPPIPGFEARSDEKVEQLLRRTGNDHALGTPSGEDSAPYGVGSPVKRIKASPSETEPPASETSLTSQPVGRWRKHVRDREGPPPSSRRRHSSNSSSKSRKPRRDPKDPFQVVKLNVGGHLYQTTLQTLLRAEPDSVIYKLFSSPHWIELLDEDDWLFMDRDGPSFGFVLSYLRDGFVYTHPSKLHGLKQEADYFQLANLSAALSQEIVRSRRQQDTRNLRTKHLYALMRQVAQHLDMDGSAFKAESAKPVVNDVVNKDDGEL